MEVTSRFESQFIGARGAELFFQEWRTPSPKGLFLITHGLGEHSESYNQLAVALNRFGWDVAAWDLRGHGRSEGKRGYVGDFADYEVDLATFIQMMRNQEGKKSLPLVLFGHSMGGLILLKTILTQGDFGASALCLSAPALGLAVQVPSSKKVIAKLAARWLPQITLWNEIQYRDLSRDEAMIKYYNTDTLRHDKVSPKIYTGFLDGFDYVAKNAEKLTTPVCLQVAGHDHIVSTKAALEFFDKLTMQNKALFVYEDSFHEVFNDLDRERVIHDLKSFLNPLSERKEAQCK